MCDIASKKTLNVVILSDYNCDFPKDNALCEICDSFDIHNLISTAACFKSSEDTLLYIYLVTKPNRFKSVLNLSCWLSDFQNFISSITKLHIPRRISKVIQNG